MRNRAQAFVEYVLLVGVALIALLITVNSFLKGSVQNAFTEHFNTVKSRITGN